MTVEMSATSATPPHSTAIIHPGWTRITHWINAIAMLVMIGSGWQIYNASPLFNFTFPRAITLGGWLGGAILWHFAAMWVLVINGQAMGVGKEVIDALLIDGDRHGPKTDE